MATSNQKNLIVNYMPNTLTQDDMKKIFEGIGDLSSCKLIRNKMTGESLGYGFVEYVNQKDAATAVSELTGLEMEGKLLKVSFAAPPGTVASGVVTGEKDNNVYVANLPDDVTEDRLLELFSDYGDISSHKLLTNADGSSRGAGFVRFLTGAEAAKAIKALNGQKLSGSVQPLTVKLALPPAAKTPHSLNAITNSTLVGLGVASRSLNTRFNPIGSLPQTARNSVLNLGVSPVAAALSGMQTHIAQHGNNLKVATQQAQVPNVQTAQTMGGVASVYVYGLQPTHSELTMYELFSPFGAIMNVKIMRDMTKEEKPCKGYGFVNFTKMDEALLAIASLNGQVFEERVLQVSLKQNKNQQNQQNHSLATNQQKFSLP